MRERLAAHPSTAPNTLGSQPYSQILDNTRNDYLFCHCIIVEDKKFIWLRSKIKLFSVLTIKLLFVLIYMSLSTFAYQSRVFKYIIYKKLKFNPSSAYQKIGC